jgi:hypothetical protein
MALFTRPPKYCLENNMLGFGVLEEKKFALRATVEGSIREVNSTAILAKEYYTKPMGTLRL